MSEIINNSLKRKEMLKHVILKIHEGFQPEELKPRLMELMQKIPYGEVVEVEQELIAGGLPIEEVHKLCDVHSKVLEGQIDLQSVRLVPPGHPVDTFKHENKELEKTFNRLEIVFGHIEQEKDNSKVNDYVLTLHSIFNTLSDVDKHYSRKENLLFPFLEQYGITGPPKVMWGKDDEIRNHIKNSLETLKACINIDIEELNSVIKLVLKPASDSIADMIIKEEQILLPMSLDRLTEQEWYEIYRQTPEIGFCLYDPKHEWKPEGVDIDDDSGKNSDEIRVPSGSFSNEELLAILNSLPFDMTFVDRNDKVKYFSQGDERIFTRSRAILKRDVRMCHPPASVGIVDKIIEDFKTGKQTSAPFWINLHDKFIHIEYFALRNDKGEYLGTLEVTQDLTEKRNLDGEQRLLSYK